MRMVVTATSHQGLDMNYLKGTFIALLLILAGCATAGSSVATPCTESSVSMRYLDSITARHSGRTGRFVLTNNSPKPIAFRLAKKDGLQLFAGDAAPLFRDEDGLWQNYNLQLDELMPPASELNLDSGQTATVTFDMSGAFLPANLSVNQGKHFLLDLRLKNGCTVRSDPFLISD